MSKHARFYVFAGLVIVLFLFAVLALTISFTGWPPDFTVKSFTAE